MNLSEKQKKLLRYLGIKTAGALLNVLLHTVRIKIMNIDSIKNLESRDQNYVFAFWHGSMLLGWYINRNKNFASLVSQSKDGDVLTSILNRWKYKVIRGSSHIGGKEALETMVELVQKKYSLAITPDGPTGPIKKMKAGSVIVSKRTTVPLVLAGIGIRKKWILKSWDKFEIPKPFTSAVINLANPIYVEENKSREEIDLLIVECEKILNQLNESALEKCWNL